MADWQHLIVVLPGIGGSVLARPGKPDDVVWDTGKGDIADLVCRPDRMSLEEAPYLDPLGLTESTKFLGFTVVPGYETLRTQLEAHGKVDWNGDPNNPVPGATVVAVPYDFRRGIVEAAQRVDAVVCAHLAGTSQAERAKRVIVVAHSMGGLVARVWLGLLGRWPWCRALITLGTPHRGAPKALDWLVNGVRLAGCELSRPTELLRGWPSVSELLPRYHAVWDTTTSIERYPHELPIPELTTAKAAFDLHREIEKCWQAMPRSGPGMVACLGWSHRTPDAAFWDGQRLTVTKDRPWWLGLTRNWRHDFGDGTVPAFSALPIELDNQPRGPDRLAERHGPMACSSRIMELLAGYEGRPRLDHIRGEERPPTIGLDLDEVHAAGEPITVEATLREVDAELSGQGVWALLRPHGDQAVAPVDTRLEWDSERGCFHGTLPGQAEGLYDVEVRTQEVPGAGDLDTCDTVAVVAEE